MNIDIRALRCFLHILPVYSRDRATLRGYRAEWIASGTYDRVYRSGLVATEHGAL